MAETLRFSRACLAAPHPTALAAGQAVLQEGGNAIEAMVAMAATIAVTFPHVNGIGGDGFWLIRNPDGKIGAIDASGSAGAGATLRHYQILGREAIPPRGPDAALTVPGAVSGWALALDHARRLGGRLPLDVLLHDAMAQAREGCPVSVSEATYHDKELDALKAAPGFAAHYLAEGALPDSGAIRRFPALAATFGQLAHAGLDDFYRGDLGREIAADWERIGGLVTRDDMRRHEARWRAPLSLRLDGVTLHNTPPATQGLVSLVLLGLRERLGPGSPDSFAHVHGLIESAKRAMALRGDVCVDPARLDAPDPARYLSAAWLAREAAMIDMTRAARLPVKPAEGGTIWMGAVDGSGLAVSYIQSIYWEYGSGCVLPQTGLLLQNRGLAFSLDPASRQALAPGAKPFHTLNPPMAVFDDGRILAYGTMGGDGQPQVQAQVLSRIRQGQDIADALAAPRFLFGRAWGEDSARVKLEDGFDSALARALASAGHDLREAGSHESQGFGHAGAVMQLANGRAEGAHDPRAGGGAAGL